MEVETPGQDLLDRCSTQLSILLNERIEATHAFLSLTRRWAGYLSLVLLAHDSNDLRRLFDQVKGDKGALELVRALKDLRQEALFVKSTEYGGVVSQQRFAQSVTEREGWDNVAHRLELEARNLMSSIEIELGQFRKGLDQSSDSLEFNQQKEGEDANGEGNEEKVYWSCSACHFRNDDPQSIKCMLCKTHRAPFSPRERDPRKRLTEAVEGLEERVRQWCDLVKLHVERYRSLGAQIDAKHRGFKHFVQRHGLDMFEVRKQRERREKDKGEAKESKKEERPAEKEKEVGSSAMRLAIEERWRQLELAESRREAQESMVQHLESKLDQMAGNFGAFANTHEMPGERVKRVLEGARKRLAVVGGSRVSMKNDASSQLLPQNGGPGASKDNSLEGAEKEVKSIQTMHKKMKEEAERLDSEASELRKRAKASGVVLQLRYLEYFQTPENLEKIILIQRKVRQLIDRRRTESRREKIAQFRARCCREILSSERTYVSNMAMLLEYFMDPLVELSRTNNSMISSEEIDGIFSNIRSIHSLNNVLLSDLEEIYKTSDDINSLELGPVFLRLAPFMKLYTQYVNNYTHALVTLAKCKERRPFRDWLTEITKKTGSTHEIESYLIQPIQRLPRYVLLLQDLIKLTENTHKDYNALCNALQMLKEVTKKVNETRRTVENLEKVFEVQMILTENTADDDVPRLLEPSRTYVCEGSLFKARLIGARTELVRRYCFLFNDLLLTVDVEPRIAQSWYGTNVQSEWRVDDIVPLATATIVQPSLEGVEHGFKLVYHGGTNSLTLEFGNKEKRDTWFEAVNTQINQISHNSALRRERGLVLDEDLDGATPIVKKGYLTKQGGFVHSWKRRWFVLKKDVLSYYADEADHEVLGTVNLRHYVLEDQQLKTLKEQNKEFGFALCPKKRGERVYYVCADNATEYEEWLKALQRVTAVKDASPPEKGKKTSRATATSRKTQGSGDEGQKTSGVSPGTIEFEKFAAELLAQGPDTVIEGNKMLQQRRKKKEELLQMLGVRDNEPSFMEKDISLKKAIEEEEGLRPDATDEFVWTEKPLVSREALPSKETTATNNNNSNNGKKGGGIATTTRGKGIK